MRSAAVVLCLLVLAVTPTAQGATPVAATLRLGRAVVWHGGPLEPLGASQSGLCPREKCDDFFLDVRLPRPDATHERFVQIEIASDQPLLLNVFEPGVTGPTSYSEGVARLIRPRNGVWRIQVVCGAELGVATDTAGLLVARLCNGAKYRGRATAGMLAIPRAVAHRSGGRAVIATRVRSKAPFARMYSVGASAFEPTLGITKNGSIFFQGIEPSVRRSSDGGRTWADVSPRVAGVKRHATTEDPYLYVDRRTSRVFTVDLQLALACSEISFSDDVGASWTTSAACGHVDNEKLFAGPPALSPTIGYPNVVYYCAINGGLGHPTSTMTTCSKSLDGGLTFAYTGSPAFVDDPSQGQLMAPCDGGVSQGVVGPDGTVYLPKGWCGQPYVAISHNEGATWTRVQVADNGTNGYGADKSVATGVALDAAGNLYYTWVADDDLPYLAVSHNHGRSWSKPMMIGPPGLIGATLPAIDAAGPGKIAISYMGTDPASAGWNGYITMSADALSRDPVFYSAPVNDPSDPLVRSGCGPIRCAGAGDFFNVRIGPDGTPWAAFSRVCQGPEGCPQTGGSATGIVGRLVGGPTLR